MPRPPEIDLRPLTARSVVLSLLLGAHPPEMPVRHLVRVVDLFDISEPTLRVALTRMVSAGDLRRTDSTYRLSERLVRRQLRQDDAVDPATTAWDGTWEMVAVTATGRTAAERAALRTRLTALRLAELREGLWLRPANLTRPWPPDLDGLVERFTATHADPDRVAATLWDLDAWASTATALSDRFRDARTPADRFTTAAAIVRTLLTDPVLPADLLPGDPWPADALRAVYRAYRAEMIELGSDSLAR